MTETLTHAMHNQQAQPELSPAMQALEALELSPDTRTRAEQVASLMSGEAVLQAATIVHEGVAPSEAHFPSSVAREVVNNGVLVAKLLQPAERAPLLSKAVDLIHQLDAKRQPGEEQAFLNRSANILAMGLVMTHHFEDGNGRTARTLAHAVRYGSAMSPDNKADIDLMSTNRPLTGFRVTAYLPLKAGRDMAAAELLDAVASVDVPLAEHESYDQIASQTFDQPYAHA